MTDEPRTIPLEKISAAIVGLATLAFAAGLIIVNLRLASFGVFSYDFARAEYILVGALFCLLVALSEIAISVAAVSWRQMVQRWRARRWSPALAAFVIGFLPYSGLAFLLGQCSDNRLSFLNWKTWASLVMLGAAASNLRDTVSGVSHGWMRSIGGVSTTDPLGPGHPLVELAATAAFFLVALAYYSHSTFPYLSSALGGGYKDQVLLFTSATGSETLRHLGLPSGSDDHSFGPLNVLLTTDAEVVVLPGSFDASPRMGAVRLRRDLVEAVLDVPPP